MPEISRFFGVVIAMFHNDHSPPHFHARYEAHKAMIDIQTLALMQGSLPPRVLGFVAEWAALHRDELMENWNLAKARAALKPVPPLE